MIVNLQLFTFLYILGASDEEGQASYIDDEDLDSDWDKEYTKKHSRKRTLRSYTRRSNKRK